MHPIASIELRDNEAILINLKEFKGIKYVDMRVYFESKEVDIMLPSKKGLTFYVTHLNDLIVGLKEVEEELQRQYDMQTLSEN